MKSPLAIGRLGLGLIFLVSGISKILEYDAVLQMMTDQGVRSASFFLPLATAIEVLGSIALILGFRIQLVSLLLAAYLIPVTLIFHRFWALSGDARQLQTVQFLKNLSIMGGLVLTYAYQRILDSFTAGTLTTIRRETYERRRAG
jgi:putative oxidoreductase